MSARRAVFLDRDGVLNRNVFYTDAGAWEAPRLRGDFAMQEGAAEAAAKLRDAGFLLFLVSNQPNVVNGKSTAEELDAMHATLTADLRTAGVTLAEAFYCRHHPAFTGPCACRKPSSYFLAQAMRAYSLHAGACWMVGDRVTDMECGRRAGVRTAWVQTGQEADTPGPALYDVRGSSLAEVSARMLEAAL